MLLHVEYGTFSQSGYLARSASFNEGTVDVALVTGSGSWRLESSGSSERMADCGVINTIDEVLLWAGVIGAEESSIARRA